MLCTHRDRRRPAWLALTIALIFTGIAAPRAGLAQGEILERILVKVNGDIITKTELEERQINFIRQQQLDPSQIASDEDLRLLIAAEIPRLIVAAIDELLMVQQGREMGMSMSDEQFAEIVENIMAENGIESDEEFEMALAQEQMTRDDLRRALERRAIISQVQQFEIFNKVSMTEVEAEEYYESHPEEFRIPSTVKLREIFIGFAGEAEAARSAQQEAELRSRIERARDRIVAGDAFAAVAVEVSEAPSRANGGLIGPVETGELSPEVQTAIDGLAIGDVSEVVRTTRGFQLFKLEEATEESRVPFDQVRDDIATRVFNERRNAEYVSYMNQLRSEAIIEWKNEQLREAYEDGLRLETARASS